jgi:ubiquinone/menaquinone biosynthesis C-methylase UbiE
LQMMPNILNQTFDNRLIFPPLSRPRRILDLGYGNAAWALEVAEQHPRCEVRRINSPIFKSIMTRS